VLSFRLALHGGPPPPPSPRAFSAPRFGFGPNWRGIGTNEEAILRDAVQLSDQFGVPVRTDVILQQLRIADHNLVVMGVSPRPGITLFFGDAAAAVLKRSHRSILLVRS
jgi:nucleotide-binding universal stress UspA family protein